MVPSLHSETNRRVFRPSLARNPSLSLPIYPKSLLILINYRFVLSMIPHHHFLFQALFQVICVCFSYLRVVHVF